MCNEYEIQAKYEDYMGFFSRLKVPLFPKRTPNWLRPLSSVRIGDDGPAIRLQDDGAHLVQLRFGWPGPQRKPVFNMRSEGRAFSKRCIIPATGFFEFTEPEGWKKGQRKTRHRFAMAGEPLFGIAGTWRESEGDVGEAFAMLTVEPGPDVAPIHDRQIVVLPPARWMDWLQADGRANQAALLTPSPAGALASEVVAAAPIAR